MMQYLMCRGEFSVSVDMAHEKELKQIFNYKNGNNSILTSALA